MILMRLTVGERARHWLQQAAPQRWRARYGARQVILHR
jgi:hypothetical protein